MSSAAGMEGHDIPSTTLLQLPNETLTAILRILPRGWRIKSSLVSHLFNDIIKQNIGISSITVNNPSDFLVLKSNPLLRNTTIKFNTHHNLTDENFECLRGVHTLVLFPRYSPVTPEGYKHIVGVHDLHLHYTAPDEVVKLFAGIHSMNLSYNHVVTDSGLACLAGVHTINLSGCSSITARGIKAINGAHSITLGAHATDEWLEEVKNVHTIKIVPVSPNQCRITNAGIRALCNVKHLELVFSSRVITDLGMKHLTSVQSLTVCHFSSITNDFLKYLTCLKSIKTYKTRITKDAVVALGITWKPML